MVSIAREKIAATDKEIEAAFVRHAQIGLCVDDGEFGSDVTFGGYAEIEEFRRARSAWRDPGVLETDSPDVLVIRDAQAFKGQRRRDVVLIRFGEHCAIHGMDS